MDIQDMTPAQRVNQALLDKHIQKKTIAEMIHVPPTTLHSWLMRGGDFPASYIVPLAHALGVHPLWLLTGADDVPPVIPDEFMKVNEDERFLIQTYRAIDREGQIVVANKAVEELRRAKVEQGNAAAAAVSP